MRAIENCLYFNLVIKMFVKSEKMFRFPFDLLCAMNYEWIPNENFWSRTFFHFKCFHSKITSYSKQKWKFPPRKSSRWCSVFKIKLFTLLWPFTYIVSRVSVSLGGLDSLSFVSLWNLKFDSLDLISKDKLSSHHLIQLYQLTTHRISIEIHLNKLRYLIKRWEIENSTICNRKN